MKVGAYKLQYGQSVRNPLYCSMKFAVKEVFSTNLSLLKATKFFVQDLDEGSFACMINIEADSGSSDLMPVINFTWNAVSEYFREHRGEDEIHIVEGALDAATQAIARMLDNTDDWQEGLELNLAVISALHKNHVKFGLIGDIDIVLLRENKNENMIEAAHISEVMTNNEVQTASVEMQDSDRLVVSKGVPYEEISSLQAIANTFSTGLAEPGAYLAVLTASGKYLQFLDERDGQNASETEIVSQVENIANDTGVESAKSAESPKTISESASVQNTEKEPQDRLSESAFAPALLFVKNIPQAVVSIRDHEFFIKAMRYVKLGWQKAITISMKLFNKVAGRYARKKYYKKIASWISTYKYQHRQHRKTTGIELKGYEKKNLRNKRLMQALVALLILGFLYYAVVSIKAKNEMKKYNNQLNTQLTQIEKLIQDADNSISVSRDNATKSLKQASDMYAAISVDDKKISETERAHYNNVWATYQSVDDQLNNRIALKDGDVRMKLLKDLRVELGAATKPTDMMLYTDDDGREILFVSDSGNKSMYYLTLTGKDLKAVPDSDKLIKSPLSIDYGNRGIYVYDNESGVLFVNEDNGSYSAAKQLSGLTPVSFDKPSRPLLAILTAGDWVYLLNPDTKTIYKAQGNDGVYGLPFAFHTDENLAYATDFFADLNVYILTDGNGMGIKRYVSNYGDGITESPVTIANTDRKLDHLVAGFTGGDMTFGMYVFDKNTRSLFKLEKPIEGGEDLKHPGIMVVQAEYIYRGDKEDVFSNVRDIVVDEQESNAYILDGTRIWQISL